MRLRNAIVGMSVVAATTMTTARAAPDADARHVRAMAATCAACHGTDGAAVPREAMPVLAGYPRAAFVAQMKSFRDGTREATVMHQIARGYTDDEIDALGRWFAARKRGSR